MLDQIDSSGIITFQGKLIQDFHASQPGAAGPAADLWAALEANAIANFTLWHLEDEARRKDVKDSYIASIKRKIDGQNQMRNDFIENIDSEIIKHLPRLTEKQEVELPVNSETPGSIIDRLCIGSLKIYHMREQLSRQDVEEAHIQSCRQKLHVLQLQKKDLGQALDILLDELKEMKKQLKVYRQFKMYNDPELNPMLYEK